jgi:hypothetical protein
VVRISWQFVGIVNRGSEQNALVSLTLFVTPKPLLTSNAKRPRTKDDDETSELVRQLFLRFYSHVYSQVRGSVSGGSLGVV